MREFGKAKGIPTAQTEMGPATINDLFADLTLGGVSYWEVSYSSGQTLIPSEGQTTFTPAGYYFPIRQVTHYVRPGAIRIATTSSKSCLDILAFAKNGSVTTIISNTENYSKQTVNLRGLPPGAYGLSQVIVEGLYGTTSRPSFQEFGVRTVEPDGTLTLNVSRLAIVALYPYSGPNHPPTIMTWGSNPGRVIAPSSTATLFVTANDPELDPLTYHWSMISQPAGAGVLLAQSNAATTAVSGLTRPGAYVFNVDVRDGVNTSSKQVYLVVYNSNQRPILGHTGFRMPPPYGYAMDFPGETPLHTTIALPTTSVILSANVSDPDNDALKGTWSVVSQPTGASVALSSTNYIYMSFRSTVARMTVPGDYVFQIAVSDASHTVTARVACTVAPINTAPVISSISATRANLALPDSSTRLSAVTSDVEGDLLRYWWVVKTAPAGARPLFVRQGWSETGISGLTSPGAYTFTLRTFDDTHMTTRDVVVTVHPAPGARASTAATNWEQ
jgi:hypothetical protein